MPIPSIPRLITTLLAAVVLATTVYPAHAGLTSSGTTITVQPAPSGTLDGDDIASATAIFVWYEGRTILTAAQGVEHDGSTGSFNSTAGLTSGTLPTVTTVHSYYVHFDSDTTASTILTNNPPTTELFLEFDRPIIGVQVTTNAINNTDSPFGPAGLTYGTLPFRGFELGNGADDERIAISTTGTGTGTRWRLTINNARVTGTGVDSLRVLTAPEPHTWSLFAVGAAALASIILRRRRQRRTAARSEMLSAG